jgi:hypothetical protein
MGICLSKQLVSESVAVSVYGYDRADSGSCKVRRYKVKPIRGTFHVYIPKILHALIIPTKYRPGHTVDGGPVDSKTQGFADSRLRRLLWTVLSYHSSTLHVVGSVCDMTPFTLDY